MKLLKNWCNFEILSIFLFYTQIISNIEFKYNLNY